MHTTENQDAYWHSRPRKKKFNLLNISKSLELNWYWKLRSRSFNISWVFNWPTTLESYFFFHFVPTENQDAHRKPDAPEKQQIFFFGKAFFCSKIALPSQMLPNIGRKKRLPHVLGHRIHFGRCTSLLLTMIRKLVNNCWFRGTLWPRVPRGEPWGYRSPREPLAKWLPNSKNFNCTLLFGMKIYGWLVHPEWSIFLLLGSLWAPWAACRDVKMTFWNPTKAPKFGEPSAKGFPIWGTLDQRVPQTI